MLGVMLLWGPCFCIIHPDPGRVLVYKLPREGLWIVIPFPCCGTNISKSSDFTRLRHTPCAGTCAMQTPILLRWKARDLHKENLK